MKTYWNGGQKMNRNKRMLKNTLIYFIGNFGSKLLSFFLLPIYTNYLSPEKFGTIDLVLSIIPLIGPIVTLQTTESIFRFLFDCKTQKEKTTAISSALIIYLVGMFIFIVFYIPYCVITHFQYSVLFVLYFMLTYLGIFLQQVIRGFHQNLPYTLTGIISTFVQAIVNILLIKSLEENSLLIAPIVSSICIILFGIISTKLYKYVDFRFINKKTIHEQLSYSVPLVPNQICWWFNGVVGKYIINFFVGGSANGVIALATKFPNLVSTIMQIYFLAWVENSIYEYNSKDRDVYFSNNLNGLIEFLMICISFLLIVIKVYLFLAINDSYAQAFLLIPILLYAMLFNSIATFLGSIYTASKETKSAFTTTLYAAGTNIVCSFVFIYFYGIIGYAIANLASYVIFVIVRYRSIRNLCKITLKVPNLITWITTLIGIGTYLYGNITTCIIVFFILVILFLVNYKKLILNLIKRVF